MIARVRFELGAEAVEAVLGDDLRWRCPAQPWIESFLFVTCDSDDHDGPQHGQLGHIAANEAARIFKGTVEFPPRRPPPDGVDF